jgi:hypothetical protein
MDEKQKEALELRIVEESAVVIKRINREFGKVIDARVVKEKVSDDVYDEVLYVRLKDGRRCKAKLMTIIKNKWIKIYRPRVYCVE